MDRRRMMTKKARLPSEYQEVWYIESTGTQYIDTSYAPNRYIEIYFSYKSSAIQVDKFIFGVNPYYIGPGFDNQFLQLYCDSTIQKNLQIGTVSFYIPNDTIRHDVFISNNTIIFDGEANPIRTANIDSITSAICIFARTYGNRASSCSIYSFEIFNNDGIVRDYIPCYRKLDGVIGMYDLCGSICPLTYTPFYINSGTGTFTKGADVK